MDMMKNLADRTGLVSASSVQYNSYFGTCKPLTTEDNAPMGSNRPLTTCHWKVM